MSSWLPDPPSWLQIAASMAVISVLFLGVLLRARKGRLLRGLVTALFGLAALVGTWNFFGREVARERLFNEYDFLHYYLPAKYAQQVGYYNLYVALAGAQRELGLPLPAKVRDLRSNETVSSTALLSKRFTQMRAKFSDERWESWKRDVGWFRERMSGRSWAKALVDRGYNGTPVWTMIWGWLARQVPTSNGHGMLALAFIDVGLWAAAFAAVAWAFGLRATFIVMAMFGLQFVTNWPPLKFAYARTEWMAELLAAMAFMKKGRHATAGVLVGLSTVSRIFPVFWAVGAVVMATRALRRRQLDREATRFLVAMGLVCVSLTLGSVAATSTHYWRDFLSKISELAGVITSWRVGFEFLYTGAWDGQVWGGERLTKFHHVHPLIIAIPRLCAVVGAVLLAPRLRERWEQLVLGFMLAFFLQNLLYYYYVMLLAPTLWLATRSEETPRAAALAWMFGTSALVTWLCRDWDRGYQTYFAVSVSIFALIAGMVVMIVRDPASRLGDTQLRRSPEA